jgi:vacuolar-type H+-ATPase subunit I/STV1
MVRLSPASFFEYRVPVTARLSKRFYDVLGEDVANELVDWFNAVDLTYRADLRELNELNFARFDAKLEQRMAELRAELRQEIAELRAELRTEIAKLRTELRTELAGLRVEFRTDLHQVRTELLRWMFGFWVTTLLGIAGLLIALRGQ